MQSFKNLLIPFISVFAIGALSGYFSRMGTQGWYAELPQATLTPPAIWFRIVWSILYVLQALSFWLILRAEASALRTLCIKLFSGQLILQLAWCFCFFFLGQTGLGLILMLALLWVVWNMLKSFAKVSQTAAYLNYPLFAWLAFATWLNISYVWINGAVI